MTATIESVLLQIEEVRRLDAECNRTSAILDTFPTGPTGITPDSVKFSPAYRAAKKDFVKAFDALRAFNSTINPEQKRAMRDARRQSAANPPPSPSLHAERIER